MAMQKPIAKHRITITNSRGDTHTINFATKYLAGQYLSDILELNNESDLKWSFDVVMVDMVCGVCKKAIRNTEKHINIAHNSFYCMDCVNIKTTVEYTTTDGLFLGSNDQVMIENPNS